MPSSELLNDLTSEPISRRAVATGLWAAPVIALTAAAPAFAASGTAQVTLLRVAVSGSGGGRWRVTISGAVPSTAAIIISPTSGKVAYASGPAAFSGSLSNGVLTVSLNGATGAFEFTGSGGPAGDVSSSNLTPAFSGSYNTTP